MPATSKTVTWVDEETVKDVLDVSQVMAILHGAYGLVDTGEATILPRAHAPFDGGVLHAVGAAIPGRGVAGVKTWTWTPNGARPVVVVFSTDDGALLGVVDAAALGRLRTAATAGLGTDLLAREDARCMAIIGTGRQALAQVEAVAAVRELDEVRVFGREPGRRAAFAQAVYHRLGVTVTEHESVAGAVHGADIVTTVTRSASPVLPGTLVEPGMHVNAVGAIVPTSRELDTEAIRRCTAVAVEWRQQARSDAGDLRVAVDDGALAWDDVCELGELIGGAPGRTGSDDITLLRTLGVGLSDVAVASSLLQRTTADGPTSASSREKEN
jgi:ornithine cyclodeaminase